MPNKNEELRSEEWVTTEAAAPSRDAAPFSLHGSPLTVWAGMSWEDIAGRVRSRCAALLARAGSTLDVDDVTQNVLITILRRDFGRGFDPRRGEFWGYLQTVIGRECYAAMRMAARRKRIEYTAEMLKRSREAESLYTAAELKEARDAIANLADGRGTRLTSTERDALPRVLLRSRDGSPGLPGDGGTPSVQEFRCRRRLAEILQGHHWEQ